MFGFETALTALRDGAQIRRKGWRNKKRFLRLVKSQAGQSWIYMVCEGGSKEYYLASQNDLLAMDWTVMSSKKEPKIKDTSKPKPTSEELEAILKSSEEPQIEILPNGEVAVKEEKARSKSTTLD